jgi:predicted metal-dependent hydrolase
MPRTIELSATSYAYTLRRSFRAKRLRLTVSSGGALSVSAPAWVSLGLIERFLAEHAAWIGEKVRLFEKRGAHPFSRGDKREYTQCKEQARDLAETRLAHFNQAYGFTWGRVSIRNQKTRWGSCSKQGILSFNYRIALLPPELADYVIVHELCHLGAFDHSAKFWAFMERSLPDYHERRLALRRLGTQQVA